MDVVIPRRIAPCSGSLPDNLVAETVCTEDFFEEQPQIVTPVPIAMQIQTPILRQQLPQQQQPLVHELEVVVVGPDVGVLDLLAEGVRLPFDLGSALDTAERDAADV